MNNPPSIEMNDTRVDQIVCEIPTALELSRWISSNRPVVVRSYAQLQQLQSSADDRYHHLQGLDDWSDSNLIQKMGHQPITIARTPYGNADSVVDEKYFVEPEYEKMTMSDFLTELRASDATKGDRDSETTSEASGEPEHSTCKDVVYLQSQDGNLYKELLPLLPDLGTQVPIASQALGTPEPDAVNLWIGDDRSVTSLHNDPYENFYLVIQGSKTFTLFPPVEIYCMHEGRYRSSQYQKDKSSGKWKIVPKKLLNNESEMVPWIPIDPLRPQYAKFPRFKYARGMRVTVSKGDLLYLPSLWYHHVQAHRSTQRDLVIACNWWYDMKYMGSHYAFFSYLKRQVWALDCSDPSRDQKEDRNDEKNLKNSYSNSQTG